MTTGSTVLGTIDGLTQSGKPTLIFVDGDPDGIVGITAGSDLAYDSTNETYYISKAGTGSTWYQLGSIA